MTRVLAFLVTSLAPLALLSGCPGDEAPPSAGTGATGSGAVAGSSGAAGTAGAPWDPVWHETEAKDWPTVGPENNPDCGPGCRVALNVPATNPSWFGHSYNETWLVSQSPLKLAFTKVGAAVTFHTGQDSGSMLQHSVWGDRVSYLRSFGVANGQVEVMSLLTGETKVAFKYTPATAGTNSVSRTALGPNHVLWELGGLWSRHLETGAVKQLAMGCFSYCPTETVVLCDNGAILAIDPDVGDPKAIDYGGAWQTDGACSPARTQYAWVDYRDPPGPGSNTLSRSGGEVYVYDLGKKTTTRVTFDSPDAPRRKAHPAAAGSWVVWSEAPDDPDPDQGSPTTLGRLDLQTGERCRLVGGSPGYLGRKSLHGRHLYASWLDKVANATRLVEVDLDHPSLEWTCWPTPEWTGM